MSECYVSADDYRRHWGRKIPREVPDWFIVHPCPNCGGDLDEPFMSVRVDRNRGCFCMRRVGPKDRRSGQHDRRWEASRGRRFRAADRRVSRS